MFRKFKPFRAPKRLQFIDPDTGHRYSANTQEDLLLHIRNYRQQNALPKIEYLSAVVDNYLCSLPENFDACEKVMKMDRSIWQTIQGGVALLVNLYYGEENMVSQAEAEARAEICTRCEHNTIPTTNGKPQTGFRKWSDNLANSSTKGRKTSLDDRLNNCGLCTCPLQAKVHLKGARMTLEQSRLAPTDCWQRPENQK
jgi:ferredoxin